MNNDEFTKLFNYMTERFDRIDKSLETKADKIDVERILGALDALAKPKKLLRMTSVYYN